MGVREIDRSLEQWRGSQGLAAACDSGSHTPGAGKVVRLLLLVQGLTAAATAEALERDHHTIGRWASAFGEGGPGHIRADPWFPPDQAQQEELKGAVEQPPATAGIVMANWYWKVVRQFVSERFGISLSRSSCLNWLHRRGLPSSVPRSGCSRLMSPSGRPSWRSTPSCGRRPNGLEPGYSLPTRHFRADAELRGMGAEG